MKDGQRPGPKAEGAGVVVTAGDGASNIQKAEENQSPTAGRGGLIRVCDAWNDDRVLGVFFLHVTTRGEELRFKTDPPDLKTLRVEIVETLGGLVEETRTYDVTGFDQDGRPWPVRVKPRGRGWERHLVHAWPPDQRPRPSTAWRRPAILPAPPLIEIEPDDEPDDGPEEP